MLNVCLATGLHGYCHLPDICRWDVRLSYVFNAWQQGKNLCLTQAECDGLKNEMLLWLQHVPGFYDIYRSHVSVLKVHNPKFLVFLEKYVYNEACLRDRSLSAA